jgi:hypothetical protein
VKTHRETLLGVRAWRGFLLPVLGLGKFNTPVTKWKHFISLRAFFSKIAQFLGRDCQENPILRILLVRIKLMTEGTENLVLEILKSIQSDISDFKKIQGDVLLRLTSLENGGLSMRHEFLECSSVDIRQQKSLDFLFEKIQKIERRLDLHD